MEVMGKYVNEVGETRCRKSHITVASGHGSGAHEIQLINSIWTYSEIPLNSKALCGEASYT